MSTRKSNQFQDPVAEQKWASNEPGWGRISGRADGRNGDQAAAECRAVVRD